MDTQCNSKILRGSSTILFCILKQLGYHMLRAMESVILQQFESRVHGAMARCLIKTLHLKQIIQTEQLSPLFC